MIISVKIDWFNSEKANHWFNQWKFDWFRFREYRYLKVTKSVLKTSGG